jgi:adenylate kinase
LYYFSAYLTVKEGIQLRLYKNISFKIWRLMMNVYRKIKDNLQVINIPSVLGVLLILCLTTSMIIPGFTSAADDTGPFVIMIGSPGSGKSTVSAYISDTTGVPVIEVGQLLRDEMAAASRTVRMGKPGSRRAQASIKRNQNIEVAKNKLEAGELVDERAVDGAIAAGIFTPRAGNGFVLDGYPGSVDQAQFLESLLAAKGIEPYVIYLDVPDDVVMARMKDRNRVDDRYGFSKERLELFRKNVQPLLGYYEDAGLHIVNANKSIAEVLKQIDDIIKVP